MQARYAVLFEIGRLLYLRSCNPAIMRDSTSVPVRPVGAGRAQQAATSL
jgi:hypothetical protein